MADIRQIEPGLELFKHDIGHLSNLPVVANKSHLANESVLLNWRTGEKYDIRTQIDTSGHKLTKNGKIITHTPIAAYVLVDDPVKKETLSLNTKFRVFETAISADGKYVISISNDWKCALWQLPENKKLGDCGYAGLSDAKETFRPDGRSFRVLSKEIMEYQVQPFKLLKSIYVDRKMPGSIIKMTMNDDWLAAVDDKSTLRIWNLADGSLRGEYTNEAMVGISSAHLMFQPGGTRLAISQNEWLLVFDLADMAAEPMNADNKKQAFQTFQN